MVAPNGAWEDRMRVLPTCVSAYLSSRRDKQRRQIWLLEHDKSLEDKMKSLCVYNYFDGHRIKQCTRGDERY